MRAEKRIESALLNALKASLNVSVSFEAFLFSKSNPNIPAPQSELN